MYESETMLDRLRLNLQRLERVVVAFSGGADSTFLAAVATNVLGSENVLSVTAVSPSLASAELEHCGELAETLGLNWLTVHTTEMESAAYRRNDSDRCFHCKSALMDAVEPIASAHKATVLLGVNTDDLGDHRPGQIAASERGARFPMVEVGIDKATVRVLSKELGIPTWDKPAMACLASRIPNGTAVSVSLLSRIERAEATIRDIGVTGNIRVRHFDGIACIEVDPGQFDAVDAAKDRVVEQLRLLGYERVVLDLAGFRSGSLSRRPEPSANGFGTDPLGLSDRNFQDLVS